jgi:hypothetical protein
MVLRYSWTGAGSFATQHLIAKGIGVEDELCGCGAPARIEAQIAEGPQHQLVVAVAQAVQCQLAQAQQTLEGPTQGAAAAVAHYVAQFGACADPLPSRAPV